MLFLKARTQQQKFVPFVSQGTSGLVSGLIRIHCMQQCHPWQKLKLGCSRKIIRDKDSLAKNPSCVGLLFPNEEGRTPFLHLEVAESAALKAVLHLLCKISSQNEPLLTRVKTPKSSCYCIPPADGGGEQTQSCIPENFLLSSISFNSICSVCFAEGFL